MPKRNVLASVCFDFSHHHFFILGARFVKKRRGYELVAFINE